MHSLTPTTMKINRLLLGLILLTVFGFTTRTDNSISTSGYTVDTFYRKLELDDGTLDEDGSSIDFIFVKTDIEAGEYEIELTDGPGDLYEIEGTELFIKFNSYFGYAGYRTDCILKVPGGYYSSTVYKIE